MADLKDDSSVEDLHTAIDTLSTSIDFKQADKIISHPSFDATHAVKMWDNSSSDSIDQPDIRSKLLGTYKLPVEYHRAALDDSNLPHTGKGYALSHPEMPKEEVLNHLRDSSYVTQKRTLGLRADTSLEDLIQLFEEDLDIVDADMIEATLLLDKQVSAPEVDKILDWLTASDNNYDLDDHGFHQSMADQTDLNLWLYMCTLIYSSILVKFDMFCV